MTRPLGWKDLALLAALGAVVGPLLDQIHVLGGVLHYPSPALFSQPSWVYPQFALASLVMAGTCQWQLGLLGRRDEAGSIERVESALAWFVAAYLSSAVFAKYEVALAAVLALLFAWRLRERGAGWRVGFYAVSCAFGGTLYEGTISAAGLFSYDVPHTLGTVPLWLPPLYFHAALFTREASRMFVARPDAAAEHA